MSSTQPDAAATPRKRTLRSWMSAAADDDDPPQTTAAAGTADPPAASSASSALGAVPSGASPEPKKPRRQRLLAAASGDQPPPSRWSDLSPAQRCFADGLALAFSFLSLGELVRTAAVCKAWLVAAKKANISPATLNNPTIGPASSLLRWPLVSSTFRRHVHAITHIAEDDATRRFHAKKKATWTIGRVAELRKLPQLRRISRLMIRTASAGSPIRLALAAWPSAFRRCSRALICISRALSR